MKLELYVSGKQVDVGEGFSIRMNRVVADPSKIDSGTAEYSFSFTLPSTPLNDRIFGFANSLPVRGKFTRRYDAVVMAAGEEVFSGTLALNSFDAESSEYSVNLVSVKINTVNDIFGDMTLHDLDWRIPYNGAPTINSMNASDGKVYFPLVAYGVFEKDPIFSDEVADDYTDRLILDDTARFYHETFVPSMNLLELVRRLFAQKGYVLSGDIFDDKVMSNIYTSVSLANDQPLDYNYGNPLMGSVDLSLDWCNRIDIRTWAPRLIQELDYKYCMEVPPRRVSMRGYNGQMPYQFDEIGIYNLFGDGATVTENSGTYMFDPGEQCVVIPADGCYKIDLEVTATLDTSFNNGKIKGLMKKWNFDTAFPVYEEEEEEFNVGLSEMTPIEIQLVRNVLNDENNIELIKGQHNRDWVEPDTSAGTRTNRDYDTCYPHEQLYWSRNPTNVEAPYNSVNDVGSVRQGSQRGYDLGYFPKSGEIFAYDPWVSQNFICGFSTYLGPTMAVQKNNGSWYRGQKDYTQGLYKNTGYRFLSGETYTPTNKNANGYPDAPSSSVSVNGNTLTGHIYCAVWLNKNDVLTLNCVHRNYNLGSTMSTSNINMYVTNVHADIKIDAFTPRDYSYVSSEEQGYLTPTQFDTQLQLGNFLSRERTAADFVNDFIKSFNLQYSQWGTNVDISRGKVDMSVSGKAVIDIDGKCSWKRASWSKGDFPRQYGVKFSDNTDSWGYWLTVPQDKRNEYNWKDYGDSGYDLVDVDPDSTSTNVVSLQHVMTMYDTFTLDRESQSAALDLPVIGEYEVFAPGANYGEAMKKDCLDKKMRFWFRQGGTGNSVTLQSTDESVGLCVPTGTYEGVTLDYKNRQGSLLKRYFNGDMDITKSLVEVGVRLSPYEWRMLSMGALVKFDDSLWRVLEIQGFDATGANEATLTLIGV